MSRLMGSATATTSKEQLKKELDRFNAMVQSMRTGADEATSAAGDRVAVRGEVQRRAAKPASSPQRPPRDAVSPEVSQSGDDSSHAEESSAAGGAGANMRLMELIDLVASAWIE